MAEMEGRWHAMNYGNTDRTTKVAFPDALFKHPDASIKFLRRMARMGRQDSEKWDQEEVGKPKILLQETRSNYDGAVVESHSSTTDGSSQNEVDPMALVDTTPASVTEQHDAIDNVTEEPQGEEHSPETSVTQDPSLATPGSSRS